MKRGVFFLTGLIGFLSGSCATLSFRDIGVLARDLPRYNSFQYLTRFSLPEEYFNAAYETLEDPYIYIVLSDTGSPGSKVIRLFTESPYNHVSLSFDPALETLVSYNGGNGLFPPGLNIERFEFLNQKPGASLAVYRLLTTGDQKRLLVDRVAAINREGSSYNMLGLLTGKSALPNIMFCSQFVYTLLEDAGAAYFVKNNGVVRPMDFIDLAPGDRLEFTGKIFLNTDQEPAAAAPAAGEKNYVPYFDSRSITAYNII
jgi:hypothetical protein